jgi:hypothetical protein
VPKPITEDQAKALFDNTAELQKAFLTAFAGESGKAVLAHLSKFCRANEPCFMENDRYHALLEGRREVWLQIQAQLNLTVEELMQRRLGDSAVVVKYEEGDDNE